MKRITLAMLFCATLMTGLAQAGSSKIDGWISDSMCGAKHTGDNPKCVKQCIESMGAKPVFVDSDQKQVWVIDNPDSVKAYWGNHVKVTAVVDEAKKSVHIESAELAH